MALANITNNILTDSGILVTNLTPTSRTITINGTTYDLSADRSWTIATGVGGSGTTNYLPKFTGTSTIGNSAITDDGTTVSLLSRALSGTSATFSSSLTVQGNGTGLATLGGSSSGLVNSLILNNTSNTSGSDAVLTAKVGGASGGNPYSRYEISGVTTWFAGVNNAASDSYVIAGDAGIGAGTLLTLNASGNLGLGVTPSAWQTANRQVFQFGKTGYAGFIGYNTSSGSTTVGSNCYSTGSSEAVWTYLDGSAPSLYQAGGGVGHIWFNAPSGTAGNAISFTQAMTLNASGNLSVGNTNDSFRLEVTGEGRFYQSATSSSAYLRIENNRARNAAVRLTTTVGDYYIGTGIGADVNQFQIFDGNAGANRLVIASTGAATFSSSVTATGGTASYSTSALPTATISTTTTGAINAAYTSIRIGARGQSGQDQSIAITNVPTADGNSAIAFTTMDSYSYAERMRITSGGNVEINTGSIKTGAPSGGTAQPWKLGTVYTGTCVPSNFGDFASWFTGTVIEIEVNGTTYKIPAIIDNYC